jgi:hypothetical protein
MIHFQAPSTHSHSPISAEYRSVESSLEHKSVFHLESPSVAASDWIQQVTDQQELLALVISHRFNLPGAHFFTPQSYSQQLAYMSYPIGKTIQPHTHNAVPREVQVTQEVLAIKKGKLRVDFYSKQHRYLESKILEAGDVILLVAGGHGFEVLEDVEMIEVKPGPYVGDKDRTQFVGITADQVQIGQLSKNVDPNSRQ